MKASESNPYDEMPYTSYPIEWTAPERLALASMLHGGPRVAVNSYRALELGCGNGANLLPLAFFRKHSEFVGVDGAQRPIAKARASASDLRLSNIRFIHADFRDANRQLEGEFDFIIAHGVFSWVTDDVLAELFRLCAQRLRSGGLLYLNYNCYPGWKVRGLVREFLLEHTAALTSLRERTQQAQASAAHLAASLRTQSHAYSQLLANEFEFVRDSDPGYVAHEFLADENHAFWRSDFLARARLHGFEHVADADFNYPANRSDDNLPTSLSERALLGRTLEDTVDLLCYRQLHSPILTRGSWQSASPSLHEFARLHMASCLERVPQQSDDRMRFKHPTGYEVDVTRVDMLQAFESLRPLWPRALPLRTLELDLAAVMQDLLLLQRNGLIELRCVEPESSPYWDSALARLEGEAGYITTPYHTRESATASQVVGVAGSR